MESFPLFCLLFGCAIVLSCYERLFSRSFKKRLLSTSRHHFNDTPKKHLSIPASNPLLAASASSTDTSVSQPSTSFLSLNPIELFSLERRALPSKTWHCITHTTHLPHPGSYLTFTLFTLPFFLVRGKDLSLRAFHNVCRHRAYTVTRKPTGKALVLGCRYHGWSYDTLGKLVKAPHFDGVEGFKKEENGLWAGAVRVDERGWVWVRGVGGPEEVWEGEIAVREVSVGRAWETIMESGGLRWVEGWDTGSKEWWRKWCVWNGVHPDARKDYSEEGKRKMALVPEWDRFGWRYVATHPFSPPASTTSLLPHWILSDLKTRLNLAPPPTLHPLSLSPLFHIQPLTPTTFLTLAISPHSLTRTTLRVDIFTTAPEPLPPTIHSLIPRLEIQLRDYVLALSKNSAQPPAPSPSTADTTRLNSISGPKAEAQERRGGEDEPPTHPFFDLLNAHFLQERREGRRIALHENVKGHEGPGSASAEKVCKELDARTGKCAGMAGDRGMEW